MLGDNKRLRALCDAYRKQIADLEKRPKYVTVFKPGYAEQLEYWRKMAMFNTDEAMAYYFTQLREGIVDAFTVQGKEYAEFFRGKLAAIDDIITDSKSALNKYNETLLEGGSDEV